MANLTFALSISEEEWTEVLDSDTVASFGIVCTSGSVMLLIGDTEPTTSDDITDVIPLSASDTREIATDLPVGYKVWVLADHSDSSISGYKIPR